MKRCFLLILILFVAVFSLTGCTVISKKRMQDGGVFKSTDQGVNWEQKVLAGKIKKEVIDISRVDVTFLKIDFKDSRILYLGTSSGLYVSENSADEWRQIFAGAPVSDLALDSERRDLMYLTSGNQIFKTADGGGSWQAIYLESRPGIAMTKIIVDPLDSSLIYAASTSGDLIESRDWGVSWTQVKNFGAPITKILINASSHNLIYVATQTGGIWQTQNRGIGWENLSGNYVTTFPSSINYHFLDFYQGKSDGLFYASDYGLLKSFDGGKTWQALELLTPPGSVNIRAVAQNPKNPLEIYYATDSAFYRTGDGGVNWQTQHLPTSRAASVLLIDFFNPEIIYLGTVKIKK